MELAQPVDAKALAYQVLSQSLTEPVGSIVPGDSDGDRVLPYVGYEIAGGTRTNRVTDTAHITIRTWAGDEVTTSELCRRAYALLLAVPRSDEFGDRVRRAVSVGGPVSYPDPESRSPRYQATVEWHLRPEVIDT